MRSPPDYYRILHVQPEAPLEVIRSSYRTLMLTLGAHPDLGGTGSGARALNEAWGVLSNPEQRARYDAQRALAASGAQPRASSPEAATRPRAESARADPPASGAVERRTIARIPRHGRIRWTTENGTSGSSRVRDLSPRGLSFVTEIRLARGAPLRVSSDALTARALVRNIRRIGERSFLVGVEFVEVRFHRRRGTFVSRSA